MGSLIRRLPEKQGLFSTGRRKRTWTSLDTPHQKFQCLHFRLSFCVPGVQFGLGLRLHSSCLDWRMNPRYYGETECIPESLSILSLGCGEDVEERSCPQAQNAQMWALLGSYFVSWPHVSKLTVSRQVLFSHHLGSIPGLGRSPGEGKGYPLLSILAWRILWTIQYIHGVTKSRRWLRDFHFHLQIVILESCSFLSALFPWKNHVLR